MALTILAALGIWQGAERRPTGEAAGTRLYPAPVATAALAPSSTSSIPSSPPSSPSVPERSTPAAEKQTIRIGTYNIHSGVGTDQQFDLSRIAKLLRDEEVVGLNEVRGGSWLAPTSQAELLASELQLPWLFAPTENQWGRGHFGNGILCKRPVTDWKRIPLPGTRAAGHRNMLVVTLAHPRQPLTVLITHLDRVTDREAQLREVTNLFLSLPQPAVLLGDLNTPRTDPRLAPLLTGEDVVDALQSRLEDDSNDRIDWILARGLYCVAAGKADVGPSDHPHYWAEFAWSTSTGSTSTPEKGADDQTDREQTSSEELPRSTESATRERNDQRQ